jgi:hypothetical protein
MRLRTFCLTSVIAIACANSGIAQPVPLVGNVSVMPGQGANFTAPVPILSGTRLRFWTGPNAGLPPGVTMTPTFVEPGANHLTLHFEAMANAPVIANRLTNIYAGNSLNAVYKLNISVVPATAGTCGAPSLRPIDQSTQAVLVSGVTPGCNVEVWAGDATGLEPIVTSPVSAGSALARIRLPHRLSPGQIVRALQASGPTTTLLSSPFIVENNYVTSRYDNERSGWNPNETTLTVNSARHLRKICEHPVDGAIRAQSLYVQDVAIPGKGKRNVVFTVTDADSVWAFDADSCLANDKGLWLNAAGNPSPRTLIDLSSGERAVTTTDFTSVWGGSPECAIMLGITATPVVDRTTNTPYVLALLVKNAKMIYRLHALDVTTGHDQPGSPIEISDATVQFKGLNFDVVVQGDRPGLLLDRGVLYLGFGSHCDIGAYHGWVLAYDANIPGNTDFLRQLGVFNTSRQDPSGSGVWQSGLGLAADGDGTIYLLTGNGNFNSSTGSYGNTVLNLRLSTNSASKEMEVVNFFTPYDWNSSYNPNDQDFGSGGPVLLSAHDIGSFTISLGSKRFILAGGKLPKSYLIDRDCINCSGDPNRCMATTGQACTVDDPNLVVTIPQTQGIVAGPAYYTGPQGTRIYYGFNFLPMLAFDFKWFPPVVTSAESAPDNAPSTSPIPTVSSNGSTPGTGILWAIFHPQPPPQPPEPLRLHGYDANNITDNLFSGVAQKALDIGSWPTGGPHSGNSFQVPTVINGKVYAGSEDRLVVFAPVYPCIPVIDCNHAVAFLCRKIPPELILQRKQARAWITVSDPASTVDENFAYLFDYPQTENATYRVCFKDQPTNCMPEVTLKMQRARCRTPISLRAGCGIRGKPPCFLKQPWPVSPGHREDGDRSKDQ